MSRLAGCLALLISFSSANAKTFQFLYLEANEGSASGGHLALQFEDEVFHYQYTNGLTRLSKDDSQDFAFDYRYLQNRTLHSAEIAVTDNNFVLLQNYFKQRFWSEQRTFKRLQTLKEDQRLLEWLLSTPQSQPILTDLSLPAAGLFYSAGDFGGIDPSPGDCDTQKAAQSILAELLKLTGPELLATRRLALNQSLQQLTLSDDTEEYRFSQRYRDAVSGLLALRVIEESRALTADACHRLTPADWLLNSQQQQSLKGYQQRLLRSAQALLHSSRPDWGQALLVTLARLIAVQNSLDLGHWTFLDDFSADASQLNTRTYSNQAELMQQIREHSEQHWRQHWQRLAEPDALTDLSYADLEMAANRYHEWQSSLSRQRLRYQGQQALPLKALNLPIWLRPALSTQQLQQGLQHVQSQISQLSAELAQDYAYDLLSRNCVTELFRSLNQALGDATEQGLGQRITPDLHFIPFTAFAYLQSQYPLTQIHELASFRHLQLAQHYQQGFAPWVYWRESNIFSAELYRYNPDDAAFVFFTDDSLLLRPLFGAVNTLTGIGQSLWGLLQWPFDHGTRLNNGSRGVLMSLPELAFMNIRKGSYKFVLPAQRETLAR